jgi:acetoin utilization protein AcuB
MLQNWKLSFSKPYNIMLAATLINPMIPTLKPTDTAGEALDWIHEFGVKQLVVADSGKYLGIISEDQLLDYPDDLILLSDVILQYIDIYVHAEQHIFEILNLVSQNHLQIIAVLDAQGDLEGSISLPDLTAHFIKSLGANEKGAIIVLKISERDYSLAEISRLIESNGTKILSSYYTTGDYSESLYTSRLTLKLNRTDITPIISTLERFGYDIEEAHANDPVQSIDQQRLDLLLRYLAT